MDWWRVRQVVNATNGSTLLGLAVGFCGGVRWRRGPNGILLGTGYRFGFPVANAFTVGDVVLTKNSDQWWDGRERLLTHEERHTWQYAVALGLPMLPLYAVAALWSLLRGGDWSTYNVFEVRAGLADGGYPTLSRRQQRRLGRTP